MSHIYPEKTRSFLKLLAFTLFLVTSIGFSTTLFSEGLFPQSKTSARQQEFLPATEAFPFVTQQRQNAWKVTWSIHDGYYIYKDSIALIDLTSKQILARPNSFNKEAEAKYDPNFDKVMDIFEGTLAAEFILKKSPEKLALRFQGCAEAGLCYPMQEFPLGLSALEDIQNNQEKPASETQAPDPIADAQYETLTSSLSTQGINNMLGEASLLKITLIFLVLGIGLCLTPCVLPMMPIISGLVLGRKDLSSFQAFLIASSYVLAMSITYTAAGVLAASLGAGANIQIWMQHPAILSIFALLFAVLALSLFDVYELALPTAMQQRLDEFNRKLQGGSYWSAALMGVLSAIVVSPCISAPLAGALVFISTTGDVSIGATALFALGLGMGLPLIALCTFGNSFLPKTGEWLNYSKRFFGLLLIAVAIWMLSRFMNPQVILVLWGALFILAAFSFGPWNKADVLLKVILTILLLWGVVCVIGAALGNHNPLQPLKNLQENSSTQLTKIEQTRHLKFVTITSPKELQQALVEHEQSGRVLLLDFYADWCTSCKDIEREIFENPRFHDALSNFILYRADLSENSVENFQLLEDLELFGPPAILFYRGKNELKNQRIQGTISEEDFSVILRQVEKSL